MKFILGKSYKNEKAYSFRVIKSESSLAYLKCMCNCACKETNMNGNNKKRSISLLTLFMYFLCDAENGIEIDSIKHTMNTDVNFLAFSLNISTETHSIPFERLSTKLKTIFGLVPYFDYPKWPWVVHTAQFIERTGEATKQYLIFFSIPLEIAIRH